MKIAFAAALAAALFTIGCGTETTTTTTTTTADTAVSADTAGDTATGTDSTGADTTAADTAKTDTAKDTGKDTAVAPKKCAPTNNACLQTCGTAACGTESTACTKDAKCFALNGCLNACDKVELPTDPTEANCYKKCTDTAGPDASDKFYASQSCLGEKCIGCEAGDQDCQAACASQACLDKFFTCQGNNDCAGLLNCISVNKCQDQTCLSSCVTKFPNGQAGFMDFITCYQQNASACDM